jgi:transposase
MGRSRGGLTTKIHALVDSNGLPVVLKLTEGQAHDGKSAADMLGGLGVGQILLADRAYDSDALRQAMAAQGASANIKPMPGRVKRLAMLIAEEAIVRLYRKLIERSGTISPNGDKRPSAWEKAHCSRVRWPGIDATVH